MALAVVTAAVAAFAATAGATTVTRHQNPHYRVTASLLPTSVAVGGRLTAKVSVTNTTARARMVTIEYEYDGPSSAEGAGMSPVRLAAHATWSQTFRRTASDPGGYKLIVRASDKAGTSHATATASTGS
jgi:uncharacterized protein (DUF58 family)